MKKTIFNLAALLLVCILLISCNRESQPLIAISMGPTHERWTKDIAYLTQYLSLHGAEVLIKEAGGNEKVQARQAQEMIDEEDIDVLIIVPVNSESAGIIVDYAKIRGIKVIAYDRLIKNCELDCYLSFDNVNIGEIQAEYLTKIKPVGKYAILGGDPDDNNSVQLRIGQMNILQPLMVKGDIEIVLDRNIEDWDADYAYAVVNEYFKENQAMDAIIASSDEIARGAARALMEHDLGNEVLLSGQDAQTDACRRIVNGTQTMTVYKVIESLASSAAKIAISLARDEDIPNTLTTVNNGLNMVPAILLSSIVPVGESNIRMTVIADGYLDENEVFGSQ